MRTRSELDHHDIWNVDAFIPSWDDWEKSFQSLAGEQESERFPLLKTLKGRIHEGASVLKAALEHYFHYDRALSILYTYSHLRHDEDIADEKSKNAFNRALALYSDFQRQTAWLDPEILALADETLNAYLNDPLLEPYRFYLEKIVRLKAHTLTSDKEELLAASSLALQTAHQAFSALNDADFQFGAVEDGVGNLKELTHGSYSLYIRDQDRTLRRHAFEKMHGQYSQFENTMAVLINGQMQSHSFQAKARHYASSLEAALFPKNIDPAVYHSLIDAVNSEIGALHKYVALRKKILKLKEIHLYDLYVPLTQDLDIQLDYSQAVELILESVEPLGSQYHSLLEKGLKHDRWVDRYENKNKRSGAYSSGCYDSMPYILMNYKKLLRDAFTLAHEAGHSMHSLLSNRTQPYHYANYPIFVAEVASTFNEDLLMRTLTKRATSRKEKIFLINQKIEDIRTTLFRQTMFAEFELKIHEMADRSQPITPERLKTEFLALNQTYFGPDMVVDPLISIEWARIPHFYYNFYVFQYATGISAALSLSEAVCQGGEEAKNAYLNFLKGGSSQYPLDLLASAGVDMRQEKPVKQAIQIFNRLIDELQGLLDEEENAIGVFS